MELIPAQRAAADAAMRALAARRPFLLIGAAGTGKTTTAVAIIRALLAKGRRVAVSAPTHAAARVSSSGASPTSAWAKETESHAVRQIERGRVRVRGRKCPNPDTENRSRLPLCPGTRVDMVFGGKNFLRAKTRKTAAPLSFFYLP